MPLPYDQTVAFCTALLHAAGLPVPRARLVAEAQVGVEGFGVSTHGLRVLLSYVGSLRDRKLPADGACRLVREFGATAVVDGSQVPGVEAILHGRDLAVERARRFGLGFVSLVDTGWVGALGYHLAAPARENILCMAWAQMSAYTCVVPFGGRDGRLSTNPLALVMPNDPDPVVVDFSTAIIASGKVHQMRRDGKRAPEPMFYDGEGNLSDDPEVFFKHQALLPFGGASAGFRGTGLSVWIEALTAAAGGKAAGGSDHGQNAHILAIHANALGDPAACRAEWSRFRDYLLSSRPAAGHPYGPQLSGASQWQGLARARSEGLALAPDIIASLNDHARALGLAPLHPA